MVLKNESRYFFNLLHANYINFFNILPNIY